MRAEVTQLAPRPEAQAALDRAWTAYRRALVEYRVARRDLHRVVRRLVEDGYSQAAVARRLGIPRQRVQRWVAAWRG